MDIGRTGVDEREQRSQLRRRAIFTLTMLAAGSAILAAQGEPPASVDAAHTGPDKHSGPDVLAVAGRARAAGGPPARTTEAVYRRFDAGRRPAAFTADLPAIQRKSP